jgi:hypothetical protein
VYEKTGKREVRSNGTAVTSINDSIKKRKKEKEKNREHMHKIH